MPVKITKKGKKYQVSTPNAIHAKGTTKEKAAAQQRLLNAIDYGWTPDRSPMKPAEMAAPKKRK
jgi:hypothetical protein